MPRQPRWRVSLASVDCWPMAKPVYQTLGGKPKPVAASGVTGGRYPPPEGPILDPVGVPCGRPAVV